MTPRNFDEVEVPSFVIRGETFRFKRVPYTVVDEVEKLQDSFRDRIGEGDLTWAESVEFQLARLMLFLDPADDAETRMRTLVERDKDPVTAPELMEISRWAYEEASGVPTVPPTPSQPGPGNTGGSSKAASPSPAAASRR